jgi:hypothetical protein
MFVLLIHILFNETHREHFFDYNRQGAAKELIAAPHGASHTVHVFIFQLVSAKHGGAQQTPTLMADHMLSTLRLLQEDTCR